MRGYIFFLLIVLATYIEGTLTTFPLVLSLCVPYAVYTQKEYIFFYVFVSGILLDIMNGRTIGLTSVYFLCSIFAVLLYQRKYEIATYPFIAVASAVVSFLYLILFVHTYVWEQMVVTIILAEIWFGILRLFTITIRN